MLDMEKRFENGEIRSIGKYIGLLKLHKCINSRYKVLKEHYMFEKCIHYCLIEAEANLKTMSLDELLENYIEEISDNVNHAKSIDNVDKSGHTDMIKSWYN